MKYYEDQWFLDLHNSSKLSIYATFKSTVAKEKYLASLSLKKYIKVLASSELQITNSKSKLAGTKDCDLKRDFVNFVRNQELMLSKMNTTWLCAALYNADLRHCYSWLTNRNSSFEFFIEIMNDTNEEHIVQFATFLDKSFAKRKQFIDSKITN